MKYKVRDGVILRQVCGEWLIIAVGEAAKHCLYIRQINETMAFYWMLLEKGLDRDTMIQETIRVYDIDETRASHDIDVTIKKFKILGYLV